MFASVPQRTAFGDLLIVIVATATILSTSMTSRPVVGAVELAYSIDEELPVGRPIADVVSDARLRQEYDADEADSLRFALLSPPSINLTVDEKSGRIVTSGRIDRETLCSGLEYNIASDGSSAGDGVSCRFRLDVAVHPIQYFRIIKVRLNVQYFTSHCISFAIFKMF